MVATAFWRGEVENELRRVGMCDFKFKADADYDRCMSVIDELHRESIPIRLLIALTTARREVSKNNIMYTLSLFTSLNCIEDAPKLHESLVLQVATA